MVTQLGVRELLAQRLQHQPQLWEFQLAAAVAVHRLSARSLRALSEECNRDASDFRAAYIERLLEPDPLLVVRDLLPQRLLCQAAPDLLRELLRRFGTQGNFRGAWRGLVGVECRLEQTLALLLPHDQGRGGRRVGRGGREGGLGRGFFQNVGCSLVALAAPCSGSLLGAVPWAA